MLPLSERLRANGHFQVVYKQGATFADSMVVFYCLRLEDSEDRQVGFTVSKKVGNAVVRNRVKRRIRDAYHHVLPELPRGFTAIFVARKSAADADFAQIERAVRAVLTKAGLLPSVV